MRIPRNVSGKALAKCMELYGYRATRQTGSHMRLTTQMKGQHHITVPMHAELRIGTLGAIVGDIASHFGLSKNEVISKLFG